MPSHCHYPQKWDPMKNIETHTEDHPIQFGFDIKAHSVVHTAFLDPQLR